MISRFKTWHGWNLACIDHLNQQRNNKGTWKKKNYNRAKSNKRRYIEREREKWLPLIWNRAKQQFQWLANVRSCRCHRFCSRNNPFFRLAMKTKNKNEEFVVWVYMKLMKVSAREWDNRGTILRNLLSHPPGCSVVPGWCSIRVLLFPCSRTNEVTLIFFLYYFLFHFFFLFSYFLFLFLYDLSTHET